jgi:hypothetical protein
MVKNTPLKIVEHIKKIIPLNNGCVEWNKHFLNTKQPYGRCTINNQEILVHRLVYEYYNGKIEDGLYILHKCNNPKCCEISHLTIGTQNDNMKQMINDNRSYHPNGEKNPKAKLNLKDINTIKTLCLLGNTQISISKRFKVCRQTISRIINNKAWCK